MERGGLSLFQFHFLKLYLNLEITLSFGKLCYVFEEKFFFLPPYFLQKGHSKLSKNEPENIPLGHVQNT